ncbi:MAG: hypothetical protein J2P16_04840, partial [Mycobacterium sp.]|nr:hypothetical protein [Mycobacterium sp.]
MRISRPMDVSRRECLFAKSLWLRRRRSSLLAVAATVVTVVALLSGPQGFAAPVSVSPSSASAPTFDLPARGSGYSLLDGPESQNGAIASVDLAGTWSFTPASGSVDDSVQGTGSGQFDYVGAGWGHAPVGNEGAPANPYQGSNSFDVTADDYATITFTGTHITYYAVTCSACGIAAVSVDGGPETLVDLYSSSRAGDVAVWSSPVLSAGAHTLKIRVTGTNNPASSGDYVTVDRIETEISTTRIAVPGGGWYKQGFTGLAEATYSRQITIPDTGRPQLDKITFGAVNHEATMYVDGTKVGTNTTSFTPSTFDLTPYVQPGHTYTISVDVKGRKALINPATGRYLVPEAAAWSEAVPQGIFRSAFLRVYPQVYIADTAVQTSVTDRTLSYYTSITNAGDSAQTVTLTGHLTSWNHADWHYPGIDARRVTIPAHATQQVRVTVPWKLGPGSYWWPNVPYRHGYQAQLHLLNLAVQGAAGLHDTATYRFGFRQVEQRDPYYYLNGVRLNVRGDDLAGANYDRVNNSGKGDAYDTLPGFLTPTKANPGWPQVVDNYQRLNYNVVRVHQEPATPYMLDVADQMGLMLIDETAIRGSDFSEDFVAGHDNMVAHARDLALRDRNHPSVVRWSEANEPVGASGQFIQDLYTAITAVDPTRPISVDGAGDQNFPDMTQPNFNVIPHYLGGDQVLPRDNRPFGQGEFIWPVCNTPQGFTWFATLTASLRAKDASDVRPYTLLCAWANLVPGVTTDFLTDNNQPPLYGANNLPNPWANPQIQRLQAAFNPVLVADADYWAFNQNSDTNGDWPISHHLDQPTLTYGSRVTRTLNVFNDTFAGTQVNVSWQARLGSATGPVTASGTLPLNVPLGSHLSPQISFTTPAIGSKLYLVLAASKPGQGTVFRDAGEYFNLAASQPTPSTSYTIDDAEQGSGVDQFNYT